MLPVVDLFSFLELLLRAEVAHRTGSVLIGILALIEDWSHIVL